MLELEMILRSALSDAGLAVRSGAERTTVYHPAAPVCVVQLDSCEVADGAVGQYLGMVEDPQCGERELFGRRFQADVALRIFAPGHAQTDQTAQCALDTLLQLQGLRVNGFTLGCCSWDEESGCYSRTVTVHTAGALYHLQLDEAATFTDFTLLPTVI